MRQLSLDIPSIPKLRDYNVYINSRLSKCVNNEEEAWNHIGQHPLGFTFHVTDKDNNIRHEFVCF